MTAAAGDQKIAESWRELLDRHARCAAAPPAQGQVLAETLA